MHYVAGAGGLARLYVVSKYTIRKSTMMKVILILSKMSNDILHSHNCEQEDRGRKKREDHTKRASRKIRMKGKERQVTARHTSRSHT